MVKPERFIEGRGRRRNIALRVEQEQLRLRHVRIGKRSIKSRSEIVPGKPADLGLYRLARCHSLLRNMEQGLRLQHMEESLIRHQENLVSRGSFVGSLRSRLQLAGGDEVVGPAEIREQLREDDAPASMINQPRRG